MADKPEVAKDPETGRFLTGNKGGGRPKGARAKLGEDFLCALQEDFAVNGAQAVEKVRAERPQDYLKIIASLLPRDVNVNINALDEIGDDELVKRIRDLDAVIGHFLAVEGAPSVSVGAGPATTH